MNKDDDVTLIPVAIASQAAAGNVATIPATQATAGDGRVSIDLGYPPECAISVAAGGKYPEMKDANGIYRLLSSAIRSSQSWGILPFDADFAAGIGGYPAGAIVSGSTPGLFWVSTADNNTTTPGASGATWQSIFAGYITQAQSDARYVRGIWNAATDQRILSIAHNKTDSGIYVQLDNNTSQRLQLFGDYATNPALNALALTVVTKNASQGPGINNLGIVSRSGQPYCVDDAGVLRYLVKSPGATPTDIPIQSVGINNQRIYVSYDNDMQAAWLVRSPAEGSIDTRVGSVGIANGRPYFGYGGSNDAANPLWLALASDIYSLTNMQSDFSTSDNRVINLPYGHRIQSFKTGNVTNGDYVAFPISFSGTPVAIICQGSRGDWDVWAQDGSWTANGFTIQGANQNGGAQPLTVIAIGTK